MSTVFWISGLAGSGKSTVAKFLCEELEKNSIEFVYLDGDIIREAFANTDYSYNGRKKNAYMVANFCKILSEQGVNIVASFIASNHEVQQWSRENIQGYYEVFIDVPIDEIYRRDKKNLYSRALAGIIDNVVGVDIEPEPPLSPDCTIKNYGEITPELAAKKILEQYCKNANLVKKAI